MAKLTHLDEAGRAAMVDVAGKPATKRVAVAEGRVVMAAATLDAIFGGNLPKGSGAQVLAVARVAGIQAAKKTADLIPLCHPLPLSRIDVQFERAADATVVRATAATTGPTGVEMEALTAVSVACLTLYDMTKAVDATLRIEAVRLRSKTGGRSGDVERP